MGRLRRRPIVGVVEIERWKRHGRVGLGMVAAGVAVAGLAYRVGVDSVAGQQAEDRIVADAQAIAGVRPEVLPVPVGLMVALAVMAVVAVGLVRRRVAAAVATIAFLVSSAGAGALLKTLLPGLGWTWPTGYHEQLSERARRAGHVDHGGVAAAHACWAAVGGCGRWDGLGESGRFGDVIAAWHRPSDVVEAVALCVVLFVVATTVGRLRESAARSVGWG